MRRLLTSHLEALFEEVFVFRLLVESDSAVRDGGVFLSHVREYSSFGERGLAVLRAQRINTDVFYALSSKADLASLAN